ncbi:MAG: 4-(cytidine 5'-diphospho)-2-C-methyl-D-erythritol kinase [Alphaproteobacteria bacterium]|nr:4-(cytidine 5'-diphospho)-2-C-methyl-D-erythritol kinase [Alphaproteobacteria bacterium]
MASSSPTAAPAGASRVPVKTRSGYRAAAPAKINLYLHVVGKRADGYHLLDSLVAFADVHDTVIALEDDALSLKVSGPFGASLAGEADNLVLRAARRLAELGGVKPRAKLRLIKRLPVASGIGGGSSDAAAALRALSALWGLRPAAGDLHRLALGLGADVPVCLGGRAVHMGGIGEKLMPAPRLPEAGIVLVNPGVPLATPPVFKARQGPFSATDPLPSRGVADARQLADLLASRKNDLTRPATALLPVVGEMLAKLAGLPGCLLARMSGSGATCFGLFADPQAAIAAAAPLARAHAKWWVAPGRLVDDVDKVKPQA